MRNNLKVSMTFMSLVFFFPYRSYAVWRSGQKIDIFPYRVRIRGSLPTRFIYPCSLNAYP